MMANPFPKEMTAPGECARGWNHRGFRRQEGVILIIALIVLVAMTLAGITLVRSVDTGNMVAGNLGFKQGATSAADAGTEAGIVWLTTVATNANAYQDQPTSGYYATSQNALDMTGGKHDPNRALVDWDFNNCNGVPTTMCIKPASTIIDDGVGNKVRYIIHRLCQSAGDPNNAANSCANFQSSESSSPIRGELKYGADKRFDFPPATYYRITSRAKGPRNTISFVETILHF